jgi:hypothetical protein
LLVRVVIEGTLVVVKESSGEETPYTTQAMNLEYLKGVIDSIELEENTTANIEKCSYRSNQNSSPVLDSVCYSGNRHKSYDNSIAKG